jgi:hypothetical protein
MSGRDRAAKVLGLKLFTATQQVPCQCHQTLCSWQQWQRSFSALPLRQDSDSDSSTDGLFFHNYLPVLRYLMNVAEHNVKYRRVQAPISCPIVKGRQCRFYCANHYANCGVLMTFCFLAVQDVHRKRPQSNRRGGLSHRFCSSLCS